MDADSVALGSLTSMLRIAGYNVEAATSRADALLLMARHEYAIIVSNIRMPALDGPPSIRNWNGAPSK